MNFALSRRLCSIFAISLRGWLSGIVVLAIATTAAQGEVFRLRGTGTLAGPIPPFGMLGEELSIVVDINSELLSYDSSQAPGIRKFPTSAPFSISVVGATSGAFPDIDPVTLLRAVDGPSGTADDLFEIRSGTANEFTTLLSLRCAGGGCLDEASSPATPAGYLAALGAALNNANGWMTESAQFNSTPAQHTYSADNMSWTLRSISHTADVPATFDVRYLPDGDPELTEGEEIILVGGFGGSFPAESTAILEFGLGSIPNGAIITGATLRLDVLSQTGNPTLTVVTYPGDGLSTVEDGMAEGMEMMIGPVNLITAETLVLDAEYVQSLLGSASHLGVRLSSETTGKFFSMATLENPSATIVPTLSLDYLFEAPLGDFNADGHVDAVDYVVWRNSLGSTTELAADANGNGEVDTADYLIWKQQFGTSSGALALAPAQVPEPASIAMALGLIMFALKPKSRHG